MKIENSIFPPKYTRYEKNVKKQNCLFQKDLQLWSKTFFHRSYIFCLLMKNIIKSRNFPSEPTIFDVRRKIKTKY